MLKLSNITARNAEDFEYCKNALDRLNRVVQTLNGKEIPVNLEKGFDKTLMVTPDFGNLGEIRVLHTGTTQVDVGKDIVIRIWSLAGPDFGFGGPINPSDGDEIFILHPEVPPL